MSTAVAATGVTTSEHTPLPWFDHATTGGRALSGALFNRAGVNVGNIAIGQVNRPEDAAFIVSACNAHDALVEALKKIASYPADHFMTGDGGEVGPVAAIARKALKKAGLE